jgi:hypothetical protein
MTKKIAVVALLLAGTVAFALSPLARDRILFEGNQVLKDGRCAISGFMPEGRKANGFYVNVEGIDQFSIRVNGADVMNVTPEDRPQTRIGTLDLTGLGRCLKPGSNRIEIVSPEPDHRFWVRVWVSDLAWYYGSLHAHSTYSDGNYSVHDLLQLAIEDGGQYYAVTDHDNLAQCSDTAFHDVGGLRVIRGTEWTTDSGHSCVLGLEGSSPIEHRSIRELLDDASYRGGMMQINHPCDIGMEWDHYPNLDPGVDWIEVFNGPTWFPGKLIAPFTPLAAAASALGVPHAGQVAQDGTDSDADAVAWWQDLLAQGKTIAGVGNADYHGSYPGEEPCGSCSRVYAPSCDPDTVLKYTKLGQVMICDDPSDSRLYLYADTNNNGTWDLIQGQHIRITSGSRTIRFRLEVEAADISDVVYIYDKSGEIFSHTLWTGGDYQYEWERTFNAGSQDFMRVELLAELGADYEFCTNPIYVNHPDYEMGPVNLAATGFGWPDSIGLGSEAALNFRLGNTRGVSPYRFGLVVACDTTQFDITEWQAAGNGIGRVEHRVNVNGYEIVEWQGGYSWSNRLAAGTDFDYWLKVRPKQQGKLPILFRSWADDRIFVVARDPTTGQIGPEGFACYWDSIRVVAMAGVHASPPVSGHSFLDEIRPNPVQKQAEIRFGIGPGDTPLALTVLDPAGRIVRRFTVSGLIAGTHRVGWDMTDDAGNKLPQGDYLVCYRTARQSETKRFSILR